MDIYLVKRGFFTFRGVESFALDLLGKSVLSRMRDNLGAHIVCEEELPAGEKLVLYPAFPFLGRGEAEAFAEGREGSFSFSGGRVDRGGASYRVRAPFSHPLFTLQDYASCLAEARRRTAERMKKRGVLVEEGAEIGERVVIGAGAVIGRGVRLGGLTYVGEGAELYDCDAEDCFIGAGSVVTKSVLRGARIGKNCTVGPFANVRAGTKVGDGCRVGDFVELKNAAVGADCRIAHLAYVGDAELGAEVNVGCGVVFANFDGREKHRSKVGNGAFLGSNCNLIAPVEVGEGAFIAAGTTLTQDLGAGDLCIGRARETVRTGGAAKYLGK